MGFTYLLTSAIEEQVWALRQRSIRIYIERGSLLYLQTDKGSEFKNTLFESQLTEYKIKFYTSENDDIKAAMVERFNCNVKTCMCRYFIPAKVIDMSTCYKTWCTRAIRIIAVLEWHLPLLMLKTSD